MGKLSFTPIAPQWIAFPAYTEFTIGWRMGAGEDYKCKFWDWYESLTPAQQKEYQALFPYPCFWHYNRWEEDDQDIDDEEDYYYEGIPVWQPKGAYKYSIATFIHSAKKLKFVFFWKPNAEVVDESCFSQWQPSPFSVDADKYYCAEQYMMAEKARLFDDEQVREEIMNTSDPKLMRTLGRKVRNFNDEVWDKAKYSIVLNGNYYKFTQNKEMMDFLLSTGDKILVEASPMDTIWGIGLGKDNEKAHNIASWRGKNLLGFALMEVRDEIRKVYQNVHLLKNRNE